MKHHSSSRKRERERGVMGDEREAVEEVEE